MSRHLARAEACALGSEIAGELADGRRRDGVGRALVADVDQRWIFPFFRRAFVGRLFREAGGNVHLLRIDFLITGFKGVTLESDHVGQ